MRRSEDSDHLWFSDEYLEAAETFKKAKEQIKKWSSVSRTPFRDQQIEMWTEILNANRWTEPGA